MELVQWRRDVEREFSFKPEHGITLADVGAAKEMRRAAVQDSQARKILTGAKQLESLAEAAKAELHAALGQFDARPSSGRKSPSELRDYQSGRRPLRAADQSFAGIDRRPGNWRAVRGGLLYLILGR